MINKMSLRNEYENVTSGLRNDMKNNHSYDANDVLDIVTDSSEFITKSIKEGKESLGNTFKFISPDDEPIYFYDKTGQFADIEKAFIIDQIMKKYNPDDLNNSNVKMYISLSEMFETINNAYMKYFTQTGLVKDWQKNEGDADCYMETKLGYPIFTKPYICLDRFFRNNVYEDFPTYVPKTDIIAPIIKELNNLEPSRYHSANYYHLDAYLGLAFIYNISIVKRYNQLAKIKKGNYVNLSAMQYVTMIMIILTDFLNGVDPNNKDKNNQALHELMIGWLKACNYAHLAYKYAREPDKK